MTQMFVNMFTEQSKSQFACHLSMLRDNLLFVNWCHQLHIYICDNLGESFYLTFLLEDGIFFGQYRRFLFVDNLSYSV